HDFNNVLGGVVGTVSILKHLIGDNKTSTDKLLSLIKTIEDSSEKATLMVQKLLTLSRKQDLKFSACDLNISIKHVVDICLHSFDKSIILNTEYYPKQAIAYVDSTQIEQVILNLCINAAQAMTIMQPTGAKQGGTISILLTQLDWKEKFKNKQSEVSNSLFWCITVQDTGVGMDKETAVKIFDPFFTTKKKHKGTGLGLATVFNIVYQHHGFIDVYSEPGIGSTFNVYLPIQEKNIESLEGEKNKVQESRFQGEGVFLVVDDEEVMRNTAALILEDCGFSVIAAADGEEGLQYFLKNHHEIKGVLLDLFMPKKTGDEVYLEMKKIDPEIPIIMTTGFTQHEKLDKLKKKGAEFIIQKPFTYKKLVEILSGFFEE
ncbi:MAG: ATP-binding protein, partial [Spirochaetes bacterium]|nr:ATP-binding protein [Spirochaetota bacterium]